MPDGVSLGLAPNESGGVCVAERVGDDVVDGVSDAEAVVDAVPEWDGVSLAVALPVVVIDAVPEPVGVGVDESVAVTDCEPV